MHITYPIVTLGGAEVALKVTFGGLRRIEEFGIDLTKPMRPASEAEPYTQAEGVESFRRLAAQIAAFGHSPATMKPLGLTLRDVEDAIEPWQVAEIAARLTEALSFMGPNRNQTGAAGSAESQKPTDEAAG